MLFQFLSRNSVRWDAHYEAVEDWQGVGFNSSVGILSVGTVPTEGPQPTIEPFQFLSRNSVRWDLGNPLISTPLIFLFQFLSRNSVRWDISLR